VQQATRNFNKSDRLRGLAAALAKDYNDELTIILNQVALTLDLLGPGHPAMPELMNLARSAYRCADLTRGLLTAALH
jgi:hypothetical protein